MAAALRPLSAVESVELENWCWLDDVGEEANESKFVEIFVRSSLNGFKGFAGRKPLSSRAFAIAANKLLDATQP